MATETKKLTIGQKAQRYDEAIERAKKWYNAPNVDKIPTFGNRVIEEIFPELIKNNDEKIKEEIINYFRCQSRDEPCRKSIHDKWIAWLEKQSECHISHDDEIMIKQLIEYFTTGHGLQNTNETVVAWLNDVREKLEKQDEQKPADRVKPKFQKGDWITNGYDTWEIIEVKPLDYILQSQDGNIEDDTISYIDETYDSFTIQDAKDGDVLADNVGVILFKSIGDNNVINYYAYFSGLFAVQEGEHYWGHIRECTLSPATKEQCERFFVAMHDAGWEFDFEKKELKKIPQRMISAEAKEAMYGKPTAWSEEDKKMSRLIGNAITADESSVYLKNKGIEVIDAHVWLDELKYRVQPQKQWKPSDNELEVLRLVAEKDGTCLMGLYKQLKKLKE